MITTPPVPIPPGQGIAWLYPTTASAHSSDVGAANGSAEYGLDPDTGEVDGSGVITMTSSAPLSNWIWAIEWGGFPSLSLPPNCSVAAIYGVVQASKLADGDAFREASIGSSITPWNVSMGGTEIVPNTPSAIDPAQVFGSSTLGTDPSVISSLSIGARLFDTSNTPSFNNVFTIDGVGIAVYYTAPIMPIGHGANCNAYDPIVLEAGSTSAPGNGILIS